MQRSDFLAQLGTTSVAATLPSPSPFAPTSSLGVEAPFSGGARGIGEALAKGMQGALDDYNESLSSNLSRTFVLRTYDDQNIIANATVQAQFAAADSTILGIVGHVSSDCTLRAIPTYAAAQLALVVPLSTDVRITQTNYHNVFRLQTKDSDEGALFAREVAKQYKPKLPYVFVQNGDYGADVANGFLVAMNELKINTPYDQFAWDHPDFGAVADKAIAKGLDYAFFSGIVGDMGGLVGVLRQKGYTGPIGAPQGFFDAGTLQLGSAANGMLVSTSIPYLPLAPSTVRQVTEFQAKYGTMTPISLFGYAAAQVLLTTAQRSSASSPQQLLNALAQGSLPIDTVAGFYSFAPNGDQLDPQIYFYTVGGGKFSYSHQARPSAFMVK